MTATTVTFGTSGKPPWATVTARECLQQVSFTPSTTQQWHSTSSQHPWHKMAQLHACLPPTCSFTRLIQNHQPPVLGSAKSGHCHHLNQQQLAVWSLLRMMGTGLDFMQLLHGNAHSCSSQTARNHFCLQPSRQADTAVDT